jgi:hypothetical protein
LAKPDRLLAKDASKGDGCLESFDDLVQAALAGSPWTDEFEALVAGNPSLLAAIEAAEKARRCANPTKTIDPSKAESDRELADAIAFLSAELAAGPRNAVDLDAKADNLGISVMALARARARIGIVSRQPPGCPRTWRMPKPEESD